MGTVALMTLAGILLALSAGAGGMAALGMGGRIAVIEVDGIIGDDEALLRDIRRLRGDRTVRGWVVAINSPGGEVAPSQSIYQTLVRVRVEDRVPVIAAIGSIGASGGYYVALGADSILALPGSITGSIGVLMQQPNVEALMERLGVRMEVIKAGDQKDMLSPFRDMDPAHREVLEAMVTDVHEQFIEAVAESRHMSLELVRPLADGRIMSGRQAVGQGLVDRLGNRDEAIALAGEMAGLGPRPRIVRPPEPRRPFLIDLLFGRAAVSAFRELSGAVTPSVGPVLKYIVH